MTTAEQMDKLTELLKQVQGDLTQTLEDFKKLTAENVDLHQKLAQAESKLDCARDALARISYGDIDFVPEAERKDLVSACTEHMTMAREALDKTSSQTPVSPDTSALGSLLERRGDTWVRVDKSGGCAPASLFEVQLWALVHPEKVEASK